MPVIDYERIINIGGIKTGTAALQKCGMQPELAAHILLQNRSMHLLTIFRAGAPPVYNQKRGPKTGFNLSKTSTQGLFRGSLAKNPLFTRIDLKTGQGSGHHPKDAEHLQLNINDPNYQHTVTLPVTMQDILKEVGPNGDLIVLGYERGQLRLGYREGLGDIRFNGQFVIDLNAGDSTPLFYSRPWDRPDAQPDWDKEQQVIKKPDVLSAVPDVLYRTVFNQTFLVNYTEAQGPIVDSTVLEPAMVFANTPRTARELRQAILECEGIDKNSPAYQTVLAMSEQNLDSRKNILMLFSDDELKTIYDSCALVTTGDWDGLALGQAPLLTQVYPAPNELRVYNTFMMPGGTEEKRQLLQASVNYFNYLKQQPEIEGSPLANLLQSISDPSVLFSEFAIDRAGCITPHEFLYEQLLNYSYRDETNISYGNQRARDAIQAGMDAALALHESDPAISYEACLARAVEIYEHTENTNAVLKTIDIEHLSAHLNIAMSNHATKYVVPNVSYDHNVHDLFQHGFDMRNPYGSNLEGAWLMLTADGVTLYGDTQEQLTQVLLVKGMLEHNLISVNHGADMNKGWGDVITKQIELNHPIPTETMVKYAQWLQTKTKTFKETLSEIKNNNQPLSAEAQSLSFK